MLVSEVLRLFKLILLVPITNAVSERWRSKVVQNQNLSAIIYDSRTCNFLFSCYYL